MDDKGVIARGISAPFVREGDDIVKIVVDSVLKSTFYYIVANYPPEYAINNGDVIGITESVVARSAGLYVSVDDIAADIVKKFGDNATIRLTDMIYSRNRFSMILKGIARAAKKLYLDMPDFDEVGNPSGVNPFTGVNIKEYYRQIVEAENCECQIVDGEMVYDAAGSIYCGLHDYKERKEHCSPTNNHSFYTLADICDDKNPDFGLLGCNKATEERIKLFPTVKMAEDVCSAIRSEIKKATNCDVIVMVYGDGSYKDLDAGIWELADPVSFLSDDYGNNFLNATPNEVKVKSLIDNSSNDEEVRRTIEANKGNNLVGKMVSMGTTPRRFGNLLAAMMDLISGSGERCTPIVLVQNYFKTA